MTEALVETVDVEKLFPLTQSLADTLAGREKHVIHAVDGVSLQVQKGEAVGFIGESGSGKTTPGWLIARVHDATGGEILFEGVDTPTVKGGDRHARPKEI